MSLAIMTSTASFRYLESREELPTRPSSTPTCSIPRRWDTRTARPIIRTCSSSQSLGYRCDRRRIPEPHPGILKPGDTYTLPDGDIVGNITLPRGLSGAKGKFITIRGTPNTRIIATDNSLAAIGGGGCKWLRLTDYATVGGLNGTQASQNGDRYDPETMIAHVYIVRVTAIDPIDDGIKVNGGSDVHIHSCKVLGGRDHGIDMLGIDSGSIRLCQVSGSPTAIVIKGGCRRIAILRNTVRLGVEGLHVGERTALRWQAPWTRYSAENIDVREMTYR